MASHEPGEPADYEFTCEAHGVPSRTPEWWARAVFEGAPAWLWRVLPVAWRVVLRARLGPCDSREHVLDGSRVALTTRVRHTRTISRWIWTIAGLTHERVVPYLLRRARRRAERTAEPGSRSACRRP